MDATSASRRSAGVHMTVEEIAELHRQLDALVPLAALPQAVGFVDGMRAALDVIGHDGCMSVEDTAREAAEHLSHVLAAIDGGEIEAEDVDRARIEGAITALRVIIGEDVELPGL